MIGAELFPSLAEGGARPALTIGERTLSWRTLADKIGAHRQGLARAGVGPGDRVPLVAEPNMDTAIALLANAIHGAVSVPINPQAGRTEMLHIMNDSARDEVPPDTLLILYTSGTTGPPKGAVITARSVAANLDGLAQAWSWTADDVLVHALPLFHVHGLVLGLFGPLRLGCRLIHTGKFEPPLITEALTSGGTMLFGVPTMYKRMIDAAEADPAVGAALRGARLLVSGSAGLPVAEHDRARKVAGLSIYERYGLTETLINCAVRAHGPARPGYVGQPLAGVDLRLVDDQRNEVTAHDDTTLGEIAVRGANVFSGYLGQPSATAAVTDLDGWFYTGDLATLAPDGAVRIHGRRATDLIKTGGFKVGAGEIESCLAGSSGVAECAVIGVPDADLGERIVAFVVPRDPAAPPSPDALIRRVATELAPHKRPREIRYVDSLPRNAMGKVQKAKLREP
jgi:malonyl-CoA/methylmalonyl-CoA synthetase